MTIALDATYSIGEELSGVGLYSREILFGLARAHPETRFAFCYRPHRRLRARAEHLPANARRRLLAEPFGPRSAALFHGLNQRLPHFKMKRTVVTFHDLFMITGEYSTPEFRERFTAQARDAAARADAVIAVSEFTRGQVIALLGVDPARAYVVHHGIRVLRPPREIHREKLILHVGAIQKRKNIGRLVAAFERLDGDWRLALAGGFGFGSEEILRQIGASPARDRIDVAGYVPAGDLPGWYARAAIFAFPSLDEGFGMPILEAMAAGVPVITSNRSALPEVAGDAAILVDPEDTDALAAALGSLTRDSDLREELSRRGAARTRLFTWEQAVSRTWRVYQEVLSGCRHQPRSSGRAETDDPAW